MNHAKQSSIAVIAPLNAKGPLGCGEKEFRCRGNRRQPEALQEHQSLVPEPVKAALADAQSGLINSIIGKVMKRFPPNPKKFRNLLAISSN